MAKESLEQLWNRFSGLSNLLISVPPTVVRLVHVLDAKRRVEAGVEGCEAKLPALHSVTDPL